jgi:hypothetical protein
MKTNTQDFQEMLDDKAIYYIGDGYYDAPEQKAAVDRAYNEIIKRCLDLEDFVISFFMDSVLVSKKKRVLM